MSKGLWTIAIAACCGVLGTRAGAQDAAKVTYDDHIKPILREHCFTCHNASNAKSDLALDTYATLLKGGAGGEVVLAGDLESSRLWALVSHAEEPKMPPMQDKLPDAKLDLIKTWILGGALENSGSVAKQSNKPQRNLSMSAGAARPEGPAIIPEGLSKQPVVYTPKRRAITGLAASPWAPVAAVAGHKQVVLYHTDTGELLGVLPYPEGTPHVLRFSRNGALLLAGGGRGALSGKAVVFDVKTGHRVIEVGDELDAVLAADINEDHTRIALGGPQRIVRVYDTEDGALVQEIKKHNEWITAIEFSPDGVLLATGDRNGELFVWEAETAREYQALKAHTAAITAVSWRIDSNILASASEDASARLWEMENGQQVKSWNAHGGGISYLCFAADGRLVTAGRDKQVKVWDQNGAQQAVFEAFGDLALRCVFTHDGQRVIGGDWSGQVRMWNVADQQQVATLDMNPPTLEMVAQQAAYELNLAQQAVDQAAAELAAADQSLAQSTATLQAATDALAAAQAALEKAQAEQVAAQARRTGSEQALHEKRAQLQAARDRAAQADAQAKQAGTVQTADASQ
jgi:hypothetical protein